MRLIQEEQTPLSEPWLDVDVAQELRVISDLLDAHPTIPEQVWQDLVQASGARQSRGARGMTAEQVLRALILKQMNSWDYRELAFHLEDSRTYRRFCRLRLFSKAPSKSTLQAAIKSLRAETLESIHRELIRSPIVAEVETAKKVRIDSTVVESNIHHPTDSRLLWDCVRVLTRLLKQARKIFGKEVILFNDRTRRAKKRNLGITNARRKRARKPLYRDLIRVTEETRQAAQMVLNVEELKESTVKDVVKLRQDLTRYVQLTQRVIDQTRRRILKGESAPSSEKIVSIFEDHTDIIVKDNRDTLYGHKIYLTGGSSSLILDCLITDGNPADSSLTQEMIGRQRDILGRVPEQAAFDGSFASKVNLEALKAQGVEDVVFSKHRGIEVSEMAKNSWVYRQLRNFRAGIEGNISFLKRIFGLSRCTWRSLPSFKSYVWGSIISFNLLVLARHLMA